MPRPIRALDIHTLEQASALVEELADVLGKYRVRLIANGYSKDEAFEVTMRLEERLLGPFFDSFAPDPLDHTGTEGPT